MLEQLQKLIFMVSISAFSGLESVKE